MEIERSPFLSLDHSTVVGYLKSTGSRDPDILHTRKAHLTSLARFPKLAGTYVMVVGALLTITILGSFIGIPLLVLGWWMRRRGVRNLETLEGAWGEFVGAPAAV